MRFELGALVLRGFGRPQTARVASAFERELGALLRLHGVPHGWSLGARQAALRRLPQLRLAATPHPAQLGEALARAVYGFDAGAQKGARS